MYDFSNKTIDEALDHISDLWYGLSEHLPEFSTEAILPEIVSKVGLSRKAPLINQYVLYKITATRRDRRFKIMHPHRLTKEMVIGTFSKMATPAAVVQNEDGSVFILTSELDRNLNPIGIAVKYNYAQNQNIVCSCYGRESFLFFLSFKMADGKILQYDLNQLTRIVNTSYDEKIKDGYALPEDKENAFQMLSNIVTMTVPEKKTLSGVKQSVIDRKSESKTEKKMRRSFQK